MSTHWLNALVEAVEERRVVAAILNTIEDAGRVYKQVKQRCGPRGRSIQSPRGDDLAAQAGAD